MLQICTCPSGALIKGQVGIRVRQVFPKCTGAQGLAGYLRDDPRIPSCLVRNVYSYGTGRTTDERDEDYIADQSAAFAANGYRLPDLMMQIASSPEFFKAVIPSGARPAATPISAPAKP